MTQKTAKIKPPNGADDWTKPVESKKPEMSTEGLVPVKVFQDGKEVTVYKKPGTVSKVEAAAEKEQKQRELEAGNEMLRQKVQKYVNEHGIAFEDHPGWGMYSEFELNGQEIQLHLYEKAHIPSSARKGYLFVVARAPGNESLYIGGIKYSKK
jgi:hypothetical protein